MSLLLIPPGGYVFGCTHLVYLFVCIFLSACVHNNSKSNEQIFLKVFMYTGSGKKKTSLNVEKDPDCILDTKKPEFLETCPSGGL